MVLNKHFLVSNEKNLELFHKHLLREQGGLFIGIGTDQNFVLAGWSRPHRVVIVDFDQWVVDLFAIYAIAFAKAKGPQAFIRLWSLPSVKQMHVWIKEAFPGAEQQKSMLKIFKLSRGRIHKRLIYLRNNHKKSGTPCFLNDPVQFNYLVSLFASKRWTAIRGDFQGKQTLTRIAEVARKFKLIARVIYLSNLEDYLSYTPQYKANIQGIPIDDQTVTLRTSVHKFKGQYFWAYITQTAADYKEWLDLPRVKMLKQIVGLGKFRRNSLFQMRAKPGKKERRMYGRDEGLVK